MIDLITHLEKKIDEYSKKLVSSPNILIALSGGIDSVVLSEGVSLLSNNLSFSFGLAHINYGVRPDADNAELFCSDFAKKLNVNFYKTNVKFENKDESFEKWAREIRYHFLYRIAEQNSYNLIFTAHHWDDQLETLFMRFIQNSNWISMQGIRENWKKVRRPLLSVKKEDLIQFAHQYKISWMDDPTNEDTSYLRNKIRHVLLPEAIKKEPKLVENLFIKSNQAKEKFDEIINKININNFLINSKESEFVRIDKPELLNLNNDQKKIVIKLLSSEYFGIENLSLTGRHWDSFWHFIINAVSGTVFELKEEIIAIIDRKYLLLYKIKDIDDIAQINSLGWHNWNQNKFKVEKISDNQLKESINKNCAIISNKVFKGGISIRQWKYGDKIQVNHGKNRMKVSDLFIDAKIPLINKWEYPLIVDKNDEILWIPGLRHSSLIEFQDSEEKEKIKIECLWT